MTIDEIITQFLSQPREYKDKLRSNNFTYLAAHDLALAQLGLINAVTSLANAITELPNQTDGSVASVREASKTLRLITDLISVGLADRINNDGRDSDDVE